MAYITQDEKKEIVSRIKKEVLSIPEFSKMKMTFGVRNSSTFVCNVRSGDIEFDLGDRDYKQVNTYRVDADMDVKSNRFLSKLLSVINDTNYDNSDIMTDYFDVGFYVSVNIGTYDKPYKGV